ncbi:MAG: glycosyltransferase family 2 protein, partial [Patescibacteria group bacterium]
MGFSHKYIGNPVLSGILRLFFNAKISDSHCGMRAIKKDAFNKLNLQTTGMEFASEMVVKALKNKLKIKEVPIEYKKRIGQSKLNSFSDGWKHFRFMLLYSPLFLFFIPGLILFLLGFISMIWIYFGSAKIFGVKLFYHPMFLSSLFIVIGYQLIIFALFAKTYSVIHLKEEGPLMNKLYKYLTIERASLAGFLVFLIGLIIYLIIFFKWLNSGLGSLDEAKNSIIALTFIIIGVQTIFSSFMLSILSIKH